MNIDSSMQTRLQELKDHGGYLQSRSDVLWLLLILSAATQGNSRGWNNFIEDPQNLSSIAYSKLENLGKARRTSILDKALKKAKVSRASVKAEYLAGNVDLIKTLGGLKAAKKEMLSLKSREEKIRFARKFKGIGPKYGRNMFMDIYDENFRNSIAVDSRLTKLLEITAPKSVRQGKSYEIKENFFIDIAMEAGIEAWELDRLLYTFTDHFVYLANGHITKPARVT